MWGEWRLNGNDDERMWRGAALTTNIWPGEQAIGEYINWILSLRTEIKLSDIEDKAIAVNKIKREIRWNTIALQPNKKKTKKKHRNEINRKKFI